jgi:two-component system LytT family sensor kinase
MRHKKIRFVYMVLTGVCISLLLHKLIPVELDYSKHNFFYDVLISVFITLLVWEGNLRIDSWMNVRYPWIPKPGKRILIHLPAGIIYSVFVIYLPLVVYNIYVCDQPKAIKETLMVSSMTIGVLITLVILSIEISSQFFAQWKISLVEVEKYKAESLQAQLQNLKSQINPHFLFNNLSVLSSLVYKDQDRAVDFINQLSKVYRYLLDSRNSELVRLEEELEFINSYTSLLQIRFDQAIRFEIDIPEDQIQQLLPPMALQILIENVIKHNEASLERPLTILIQVKEGMLEVSNNLQFRSYPDASSGTGLKNIRDRYKFFTSVPIEITQSKEVFGVKIPLLKST